MAGTQDDQAGKTTRHVRSAENAIEKLVATDVPALERSLAIQRIVAFARLVDAKLWERERGEAGE